MERTSVKVVVRKAAFADAGCDARVVQFNRVQMNQNHNDLIAKTFGTSDEINFCGVGIDRFQAEAHAILMQLKPFCSPSWAAS